MNDDWRAVVELEPDTGVSGFLAALNEEKIEDEARERLGDRVVVSHDGARLFFYGDSEEAVREAERVVRPLLDEHKVLGQATFSRWHPAEERWEDAAVPLPSTPEEEAAERARLAADEAAESRARGYPEWEVRVRLADHASARELAERLGAEGLPVVRRSSYVLIGADSEPAGEALRARLEGELPAGTEATVEGNGQEAWRALHPFAVFGGLGV